MEDPAFEATLPGASTVTILTQKTSLNILRASFRDLIQELLGLGLILGLCNEALLL